MTLRKKEPLNTGNTGLATSLPWIRVKKGVPYFEIETGETWTPIGQNDAITWPELKGIFARKDLSSADSYFRMLKNHGVTCLRLMLEYCQTEHRYLENPVGKFQPNMVRLWDDVFHLCNKYGLRVLLTPYDTFWMKRRWKFHPYNQVNGGTCARSSQWLFSAGTRSAIKNRLSFVTERWGASGVIFGWDLWNEIHPSHGGNSVRHFSDFISDLSGFLRARELQLHGRSHPQTVSFFGTTLARDPRIADCVFRHPSLDFATIHFYEEKTINHPRNTIDAAISTGMLIREVLKEIGDDRPFFDTEHGPIQTFSRGKTLDAAFDDEYFRHMQWAHFASGGAGGGMRWPYRHPHVLTPGMRKAQLSMSGFLPLVNFKDFKCKNLNEEIVTSDKSITVFGCGDEKQVIVWLLRKGSTGRKGILVKDTDARPFSLQLPGMTTGVYRITTWDTLSGIATKVFDIHHDNEGVLCLQLPAVQSDIAIAVSR